MIPVARSRASPTLTICDPLLSFTRVTGGFLEVILTEGDVAALDDIANLMRLITCRAYSSVLYVFLGGPYVGRRV